MKKYKFETSHSSYSPAIAEFEKIVPVLERLYQGKIRMINIKQPYFGIYPIITYTVEEQNPKAESVELQPDQLLQFARAVGIQSMPFLCIVGEVNELDGVLK